MQKEDFIPLIEITRGKLVESLHCGIFVVVARDGDIIASGGNPSLKVFLRSASKPLQAIPLIEKGGLEHFGFTCQELALMCASHSGTDEHVRVLEGILKKIGVSDSALLCGSSPPLDKAFSRKMIALGEQFTSKNNNCSGKHAGMIALARLLNEPIDDYIHPDHPVQKMILQTFAEMVELPVEDIEIGIDGCSAPVFAVPMTNAARAYARLCDPSVLSSQRAAACRKITEAMLKHPEVVAGTTRFDTHLMKTAGGKILTKGGAEGYQAVGIMPGVITPQSPAVGICLKIADGDIGRRARNTATVEILKQLGALTQIEANALKDSHTRPVLNWAKLEVGEIRPNFTLNRR